MILICEISVHVWNYSGLYQQNLSYFLYRGNVDNVFVISGRDYKTRVHIQCIIGHR